MSEATTLHVRRPRLNPFAFPSDTTLRFVLLVIFVVCGSARLYGSFHVSTDQTVAECVSRYLSELSKFNMSSPADVDRNAAAFWSDLLPLHAHCAALLQPKVLWQIIGMCLAVVVAAILYYLYPTWILKTRRLEGINSSELPEIQHELHNIAETARLLDPPVFVWNPLATGLPVAFGRHGRYYVALSGAFITQYFYRDKNAFRAIMLHELAHIRNGDVNKTYFTMSLWLAFITITLAPSLLISLWILTNFHWFDAALTLLLSILWTAVIILSGLAVLRAREYYADVQASVWDQTSQIDRVLAALPVPVGEGWRRYIRFHPDSRERRQIVVDPSRLLRLSFADAFGIGVAAWSIVDVVSGVLLPFLPTHGWLAVVFLSWTKVIVSAVIFVFAIGAIGIGVWRSAFASLLKGDHPSKGTEWLGAAFVAGCFPGVIVSLAEAVLQSFKEQPLPFSALLTTLQWDVVTYIVLLVGCWLIFRWISEAASAWFEVVLQSRSPRLILLLSVATALILVVGTLASASFVIIFSFMVTPWREWGRNWIYSYGLSAGGPVLLASVAVWAFPLAALWWRKELIPTGVARWVFLDGSSPELPNQEPLRPSGALLTGIVMGMVFWLLWELLYFRNYFPAGISDGIHLAFRWLFTWTARVSGDESFLLSGSAIGFQALAAVIAAGRARRLSAVCGLFAAFVAGCIIMVGDYIFFGIGDRVSHLTLAGLVKMGLGAVVALPTVIIAAWIGNIARSMFPNTGVSRRSGRPATISSDSSSMISAPFSNATEGSNRRKGQRRHHVAWSLFPKGCAVTLCIVVGIGMTARIRQEVLAMQEVNAYRASAERGDAAAQNKLGTMYARGQSVAQDDAQAVFWWHKAAERGHADAQYNLAQMFFMGRGVTQDDMMALQWVRKAAEQGHADAENILGNMYASGRGVFKDDFLALQWFRRAAEQGNVAAQNNVGAFYALGRGAPRDDTAAVEWLRKAAERGYADAQNNLGLMYRQGRALPKDDALALLWFRKAAEQGHAEAQFNVGQIHQKGEVVAKDNEQALMWFRKAAKNGYPEARDHLQAMCDSGLREACSQ